VITTNDFTQDLVHLVVCLGFILKLLPAEILKDFEDLLFYLSTMAEASVVVISWLMGSAGTTTHTSNLVLGTFDCSPDEYLWVEEGACQYYPY